MAVVLSSIRLCTVTKNEPDAGTDSGVELWYFLPHTFFDGVAKSRWQIWKLDTPKDDLERGRSDLFEFNVVTSDVGVSVSGTALPNGRSFTNFAAVRQSPFYLKIKGSDWWKLERYWLWGHFYGDLQYVPGTIDEFYVEDFGWLLMASRSVDFDMSTDESEGSEWHEIQIALPELPIGPVPPVLERSASRTTAKITTRRKRRGKR